MEARKRGMEQMFILKTFDCNCNNTHTYACTLLYESVLDI